LLGITHAPTACASASLTRLAVGVAALILMSGYVLVRLFVMCMSNAYNT
jgi:hypothetical protein